jgi:hypothetical protein
MQHSGSMPFFALSRQHCKPVRTVTTIVNKIIDIKRFQIERQVKMDVESGSVQQDACGGAHRRIKLVR